MGDRYKIFTYVKLYSSKYWIIYLFIFLIFALASCGGKGHYSIVLSKADVFLSGQQAALETLVPQDKVWELVLFRAFKRPLETL